MDKTPFTHDASSTAYDTAKTLVCQVNIVQADTGMDGEIIHSLFALLDEGIAVDFPSQVFHFSVYFLQGLVNGYGAYRYRTVADNPFARFVDVGSGRKVHQGVASPFATPYCLFHLFVNARCGGRITDVGIDLDQKITSDNHRFTLRVIDVGGKNGPSFGDFLADKFGSDGCINSYFLAIHVLANSYIFHFRGNDAGTGTCHLADGLSFHLP